MLFSAFLQARAYITAKSPSLCPSLLPPEEGSCTFCGLRTRNRSTELLLPFWELPASWERVFRSGPLSYHPHGVRGGGGGAGHFTITLSWVGECNLLGREFSPLLVTSNTLCSDELLSVVKEIFSCSAAWLLCRRESGTMGDAPIPNSHCLLGNLEKWAWIEICKWHPQEIMEASSRGWDPGVWPWDYQVALLELNCPFAESLRRWENIPRGISYLRQKRAWERMPSTCACVRVSRCIGSRQRWLDLGSHRPWTSKTITAAGQLKPSKTSHRRIGIGSRKIDSFHFHIQNYQI